MLLLHLTACETSSRRAESGDSGAHVDGRLSRRTAHVQQRPVSPDRELSGRWEPSVPPADCRALCRGWFGKRTVKERRYPEEFHLACFRPELLFQIFS